MAGLQDMIRSSAPGGNIGKPLMIALGALLLPVCCLGEAAQDSPRPQARNRHLTKAPVACSEDWAV
jgi:hypothetical protein